MRPILAALALLPAVATAQDAPPFAAFDLAGPAVLNDPHDLAFGPDGRLYVADKFNNRIAILDPETLELVGTLSDGLLPGVHDISFGADGRVAVAVTGAGAVYLYDGLGGADAIPDVALPAPRTEGALIHSSGRVYAMAGGIGALLAYDTTGIVAQAGGHPGAHDVAEAPDGTIWVADNFNRRLVQYTPDLALLKVIDHPRFGLIGPRYLDVTEDGLLAVADQDAHRVLLIDPGAPDGGALVGLLGDGLPGAGPGKFDDPEGIAVQGSRFYIADSDNNRIVRYSVVMN